MALEFSINIDYKKKIIVTTILTPLNDNNFKLKFEDGHQIIKPKYSILRQLGIKNIIKPPRQHILFDLIFNIEKIEALS